MAPNLWLDESISVLISRLPLPVLLRATAADAHPPLFFLLHLPAIIPFIFSCFLIYLLSRRSSLLFLVSPLHLYFATQIRMYSLAVFFYLLLLTAHLRKKTKIYLLAAILGLYTHYYFIPALIAMSLYDHKTIKLNIFAFLAFFPWLVFALQFTHPSPWTFPLYIGIPATFISYTLGGVGSTTLRTMLGVQTNFFIRVIALALSLWVFSKFITAKHPLKRLFLFSFLASLPLFSPRAMIIFSPLYLIVVAHKLKTYKIIVLSICLLFFYFFYYHTDYWYPSLNTLSHQIASLPPDSAIIHTTSYTYFPSLVNNPSAHNFLAGPSGLSPVTNQLLGVSSMPPQTFSHIYTVTIKLTTSPATININ